MSAKDDFIVDMAFGAYVNGESARDSVKEFDRLYEEYRTKALDAGLEEILWDRISEWNDKNG